MRILVIDDDSDAAYGGFWTKLLQGDEFDCEVHAVHRDTVEGFLAVLRPLLEGAEKFDATILDIAFKGEPLGGITLWRTLEKERLLGNVGRLFVATRHDRDVVYQFAKECAGGWICTHLNSKLKRAKFEEFLNSL